jgi:hypothetical protein
MAEIDGVFTEHVEVPDPTVPERVYEKADLDEPIVVQPTPRSPDLDERIERALSSIASSGVGTTPELPFVELAPSAQVDEPATAPEPVFADLDSAIAEVGDLVFIRYDDQPERSVSVRLSKTLNNPNEGIVHVDHAPLGAAILGASLDEQVTVKIGDRTRSAVIEKIEKAREALLAAE